MTIKIALVMIFASVIAISFGGISQLTSVEEAEAWDLWLERCILRSAITDEEENVVYFCKDGEIDNENIRTEKVHHQITVTPGPESPSQVIFVRPPPVVYKHNLTIKGEAGSAIHTKVFILPQNATHKFKYEDKRKVGSDQGKPSLYFLNEQPTGRYGATRTRATHI